MSCSLSTSFALQGCLRCIKQAYFNPSTTNIASYLLYFGSWQRRWRHQI